MSIEYFVCNWEKIRLDARDFVSLRICTESLATWSVPSLLADAEIGRQWPSPKPPWLPSVSRRSGGEFSFEFEAKEEEGCS